MRYIWNKNDMQRLVFYLSMFLDWEARWKEYNASASDGGIPDLPSYFWSVGEQYKISTREGMYQVVRSRGLLIEGMAKPYPSQASHSWGGGQAMTAGLNDLDRLRNELHNRGFINLLGYRSGQYSLSAKGRRDFYSLCESVSKNLVFVKLAPAAEEEAKRFFREYGALYI